VRSTPKMVIALQQMLVRQDSRVFCVWQIAFRLGAFQERVGGAGRDQARQATHGRQSFDQSLPGDDGARSA
jgi:hypothetical protein